MDREELQRRLMVTYLEEVEEHVRALDESLLQLEQAPEGADQKQLVQVLFRSVHSLKGASRAVSVEPVEQLCHSLESELHPIREGQGQVPPALVQRLFAAVDAIRDAGARLRAGETLSGAPIEALRARAAGAVRAAADERWAAEPVEPEAPAQPRGGLRAGEPTVRVRAEKLDVLLARMTELLVARGRLEARAGELEGLLELAEELETDGRRIEKLLLRRHGSTSPSPEARGAPGAPGLAGAGRAYSAARRGELALSRLRSNAHELRKKLERVAAAQVGDARLLRQTAAPLDEAVHRLRMFPFGEACEGLQRAARDVARASGKQAELIVSGGDVELDRAILQGLRDPLLQLVRNAVHHGIEAPEQRARAGKPPRGRITVAAQLRGSQVDVSVEDDGAGLDLDAIREQLARRQLPVPAEPQELARSIFQPGLSTAPLITDISGRGVGLDVVRSHAMALHGSVDVAWRAGQGTILTLTVPLTLTTIRALLVVAGGQSFAIPGANVQKLLELRRTELLSIDGAAMLVLDERHVPVVVLADVLGLPVAPGDGAAVARAAVVSSGDKSVALLVDELIAEQELVVKTLGQRVAGVELVAGATLLPSGALALILNVAAVVRRALAPGRARASSPLSGGEREPARRRLLVVDDVVTTRSLVKSVLAAAGYDVLTAVDGVDAWRVLQEQGADVVVTDIEMPRMDGFELTRQIRASERFRELPVVLVTGLENQLDKQRGVQVGANAYLIKSAFDQRSLCETIGRLL
ncbi:MAG TPA: response regulator [Polyangiaceae bacterium]|nr:response regulator [Polyangiaceae bacterium]